MGTINYGASNYINLGINPDIYLPDSLAGFTQEEQEEIYRQHELDMCMIWEEMQAILDSYSFCYFNLELKSGYYDGLWLYIEYDEPCYFDFYQEKQEAQREATKLKACLLECVNAGMCQYFPSWCTGWANKEETRAAIKEAIKLVRQDIKNTPTCSQYYKEA